VGHGHDHHHHHDHSQGAPENVPPVLDAAVPDEALSPGEVSRRAMLRRVGLLGSGATATGALASPATAAGSGGGDPGRCLWLAGDHHIHTQYSEDAMYRVIDHVRHANAYGLGWMVITDHGGDEHARIGVEKVNPDIVAARDATKDTLVFQGLEWNIPSAEHGTVFVHPGRNEVAVLKEFENSFDGRVNGAESSTPANEALAIAGVNFLAGAVKGGRVQDALFVANHPARRGIDSPHEIRGWRDAQPRIAVGMEGAPGHQAAGIPAPHGPAGRRGEYDCGPSADSFAAYPAESYRTFGGFDWMTVTVGGLWDSLLAEGKPWWITANSDCHVVHADTSTRGSGESGTELARNEFGNAPVRGGDIDLPEIDFWPGFFSRTHVGATGFSYAAVMDAIRAGRIWVDHGGLISALNVTARQSRLGGSGVTLGGVLSVRTGDRVELVVEIELANTPNWSQFVPTLARVDVIQGDVTGAVSDRDTFLTPNTKVVKSFEVGKSTGSVRLVYDLGEVDRPVYVRLRGTDGNRCRSGGSGDVDPNGPLLDVPGDADPWKDLWFYANPIWVLPH
jgi:hypothetical protein